MRVYYLEDKEKYWVKLSEEEFTVVQDMISVMMQAQLSKKAIDILETLDYETDSGVDDVDDFKDVVDEELGIVCLDEEDEPEDEPEEEVAVGKFEVGGRVYVKTEEDKHRAKGLKVGYRGTVVNFDGSLVGVEWDDWRNGHGCDGRCHNKKAGWYMTKSDIEKA